MKNIVVYVLIALMIIVTLIEFIIAGALTGGMASNGGSRQHPLFHDILLTIHFFASWGVVPLVVYFLVIKQKPEFLSWHKIIWYLFLPTVVILGGLLVMSMLGVRIG